MRVSRRSRSISGVSSYSQMSPLSQVTTFDVASWIGGGRWWRVEVETVLRSSHAADPRPVCRGIDIVVRPRCAGPRELSGWFINRHLLTAAVLD